MQWEGTDSVHKPCDRRFIAAKHRLRRKRSFHVAWHERCTVSRQNQTKRTEAFHVHPETACDCRSCFGDFLRVCNGSFGESMAWSTLRSGSGVSGSGVSGSGVSGSGCVPNSGCVPDSGLHPSRISDFRPRLCGCASSDVPSRGVASPWPWPCASRSLLVVSLAPHLQLISFLVLPICDTDLQ